MNPLTRTVSLATLSFAVALAGKSSASAQSELIEQPKAPATGDIAPEFTLPGATRYGVLAQPVRLSDYRGKTVVLAFFFKARTKG